MSGRQHHDHLGFRRVDTACIEGPAREPNDRDDLSHARRTSARCRTRILEAARQLINEQEHEAVGMEAIAATAGASRATMYRLFASKDHVVCDAALAWGTNWPAAFGRRSRRAQGPRWR